MMMKNNFVVVILFFLAITGLGFSAPQRNATTSSGITPDEIATVAKAAQSKDIISLLGSLSVPCQSALLGIVTSPDFLKCVSIPAFLPLLPYLADPSIIASLISDPKTGLKTLQPTLIQFSNEYCSTPKCSDQFIAVSIKAIQTGCNSKDMSNPIMEIVFPYFIFYSPARDSICFKDAGNPSHFCLVEDDITTLINLPKSPFKLSGDDFLDSIEVADPPAICTTCNKAIFNTFNNFINSNDSAKQFLAGFQDVLNITRAGVAVKCGLGFEDGKVSDPSKPPSKK